MLLQAGAYSVPLTLVMGRDQPTLYSCYSLEGAFKFSSRCSNPELAGPTGVVPVRPNMSFLGRPFQLQEQLDCRFLAFPLISFVIRKIVGKAIVVPITPVW